MIMSLSRTGPLCRRTCSITQKEVLFFKLWCSFSKRSVSFAIKVSEFSTSTDKSRAISALKHDRGQTDKLLVISNAGEKKLIQKSGKKEHHLWQKRDSAGSGQKAMNLVCTISRLPNEKEAVYGALDKWIAWETEFPLIAAAKALRILRNRNRWKRIIQVAKWMLSKGQGATMATYDCLLLAFDMDGRVDEAEMLWNMILHTYNRSISKRLFSRMISLYDHHNVPDKVIEVFADMEELGVKPDENTVGKIGRAFEVLGQEDKHRLFMMKYRSIPMCTRGYESRSYGGATPVGVDGLEQSGCSTYMWAGHGCAGQNIIFHDPIVFSQFCWRRCFTPGCQYIYPWSRDIWL